MRTLIILCCFLILSCTDSETSSSDLLVNPSTDRSEVYENRKQELHFLQADLDSLQARIDSLQGQFIFKEQDLSGRSYYHQNWYGNYSIADDALLAGVDSIGNFFMVSNVRGGIGPYENYAVELYFPDSTYRLAVTGMETRKDIGMELICACQWEVHFHQGKETNELGKKLAESKLNYVKGKFLGKARDKKFELMKRDLPAIKSAYRLSEVIKDSLQLTLKIDSLQNLSF